MNEGEMGARQMHSHGCLVGSTPGRDGSRGCPSFLWGHDPRIAAFDSGGWICLRDEKMVRRLESSAYEWYEGMLANCRLRG